MGTYYPRKRPNPFNHPYLPDFSEAAMSFATASAASMGSRTATSTQSKEPHDAAGGRVGYSYRNTKTKIINKKRATPKQLQYLILNNLKCSLVSRLQWIPENVNVYNHNVAPSSTNYMMRLNKQVHSNTTPDAATSIWMPVFLINLTAPPFLQGVTESKTLPIYRLLKVIGNDNNGSNYRWTDWSDATQRLSTQDSNGATITTGAWTNERRTPNNTGTRSHDHYILDWVDIKLNINSASTCKVRINTVSFNNIYAGPRRQYIDSGGAYKIYDGYEAIYSEDNAPLTSAADLWWDKWLSRKTVHPIRTIDGLYKSKAVKFHTSECVCLTPNTQFEQHGGQSINLASSKREFHIPFKQMMKCVDPPSCEIQHKHNINTGANATTYTPIPNFNSYDTTLTQGGLPPYNQDVWLMISADDFSNPTAYQTVDTLAPYFDFVVRQKVTWSTL